MRIMVFLALLVTAVSVLYKWRYRVINTLLAVSILRKLAVSITMNMPTIRKKILPSLFSTSTNTNS